MEKYSVNNLLDPKINISQPENGYRFSIDPFILAAHVNSTDYEHIIDIGTGCGIISLLLAFKNPAIKITGIEIQKELYLCAKNNILAHKLEKSVNIIHGNINNIKTCDIDGKADIIVANPPYKKKGSGRVNPILQKAIARHEIKLDIDTLFKCSSRLLKEKGRLYIIFPAQRLQDLIFSMKHYDFTPQFFRFVHSRKESNAKRVILSAVKKNNDLPAIRPPFYIYGRDNQFSDEYLSLFK